MREQDSGININPWIVDDGILAAPGLEFTTMVIRSGGTDGKTIIPQICILLANLGIRTTNQLVARKRRINIRLARTEEIYLDRMPKKTFGPYKKRKPISVETEFLIVQSLCRICWIFQTTRTYFGLFISLIAPREIWIKLKSLF